jgi:hypothetical protein
MSTADAPKSASGASAGWETRIYPGVQTAGVSLAARTALARALGEAGVEAEYALALLASFPGPARPSPDSAERLYHALEAWSLRVIAVAASLEVATQGYLTELDALYPSLRMTHAGDGVEVWWSPFSGYGVSGEPLEVRLRRCGQSYRQVVESRLSTLIEGLSEQMALLLHALGSLPPAGVAPARVLYHSLAELALMLQGDVVLRRIQDLSPTYPGLLTTLATLRAQVGAPAPIELDIAWARQQLAGLRGDQPGDQRRGLGARLFGGFRRKSAAARLNEDAVREWEGIVATLARLQRAETR